MRAYSASFLMVRAVSMRASVFCSAYTGGAEAHLFVALSAQFSGKVSLARENLDWVIKNGDRTTDEFTVARAEIAPKMSKE